jgi:hypothetical protein
VSRGDRKCFGNQLNVKGGVEKHLRDHVINETVSEKCCGDQVAMKRGAEKCSSTHYLDMMCWNGFY